MDNLPHQELPNKTAEIAGLLVGDVFEADGAIRERLIVRASIAKGGHERVVFLSDRLRHEVERFSRAVDDGVKRKANALLLVTQKRTPFSPNTLCQLMNQLYAAAGLDGAASHSGRR